MTDQLIASEGLPVRTEQRTYCRICEAVCGLVATVEDGTLTGVRANKQSPYSQGFMCTKATAMVEVTYDPDRVLQPLRRVGGPGEFEPVSWDDALSDIASRLSRVIRRSGSTAVAAFIGNPPFFGFEAPMALDGFLKAIGTDRRYSIFADDLSSRIASQAILYGSPAQWLLPDLWRSKFAVIIGSNPVVSKGGMLNEPLIRQALHDIVANGGRVVVIDPRRSETARQFEHVAVSAGGDPWLLVGLIRVILDAGLCDERFIERHTTGLEELRHALSGFGLDDCADRSGVPLETISALARSFATAESALVYGRTGTCTQRFGTLNNLLQDILMVLTGNIDRPGGGVFGWGPIDFVSFMKLTGMDSYGKHRTRIRRLPDVFGMLPSVALAEDISEPGADRIRALVTIGGNPVNTTPGARDLPAALESLDLHFSLDFYVNETNRHADYVLPVPTFFEREDIPFTFLNHMLRPTLFATGAVIERRGQARSEWEVLDELARRLGYGSTHAVAPLRWMAKLGLRVKPMTLMEAILRTSRVGDWFGLRRTGTSWKKLKDNHPDGLQARGSLPTGDLERNIKTPDGRIPLAAVPLLQELRRLSTHAEDPAYPLRAVGRREIRSHNSWMHNVKRLMPPTRVHETLVNPLDAARYGLADGDRATVTSAVGAITVPISISDEMKQGTISVAHGWGHNGGWRRANRAGGQNSNMLASCDEIEPLAAMSILNAIPVRIEPVVPPDQDPAA